ncbi:hypothetical protein VTN00DRAFT_7495 [Thermoascus crustaceus]|uniref:uncharacterized protein n=1 Tax=Thermoascus crustaceus TaxID=5088 RepID=UPI00374304A9
MKNSIPSDVWEKKRALISKLYKDEEWPLKQVIKKIRTPDFNPTETQLRSRLKKWRVTKPSRQTRRKPQDAQQKTADKEMSRSPVETKAPALPTPQPAPAQPPQQKELPSSSHGWYSPNGWYAGQQGMVQQPKQEHPLSNAMSFDGQNVRNDWVSPRVQQQPLPVSHHGDASQLRNSTSAMQQYPTVQTTLPNPNLYATPNPVTTANNNNIPINTTPIMPPAYTTPPYSVSSETGLPSPPTTSPPSTTTTVQWPTGADHIDVDVNAGPMTEWFSTLETVNQPQSLPYYATNATNPSMIGYPQQMQSLPRQEMMYPQPQPFCGAIQANMAALFPEVKPWKRAIAVHYDPQAAGGHARVDRQGRQRKPLAEKKRKDAIPTTSAAMMLSPPQPQTQFLPHEQHRMIAANGFPYQEPLVQKPPGSGQ